MLLALMPRISSWKRNTGGSG